MRFWLTCHSIVYIACLFFADDLVLCSPSRFGLQQLLNICAAYCKKFCLDFNVKKYKYLGVDLCAGKVLSFSPTTTIRSFHRAANAILYSRVKPSNDVLMKLLYSNCVPIITYASAIREFNAADMYRCHVAVNNAIRKVFSFAVWLIDGAIQTKKFLHMG